MYPVSQRALDSMARSGRQSARIDVLHDGQLVQRLGENDVPLVYSPVTSSDVPAIDGTVNVSRNDIGRDGSFQFLDLGGVLTPNDVKDLFALGIAEVRPWIGIHYTDATSAERIAGDDVEWVPLGTLVVTATSGTYPELTVTAFDRLWFMSEFSANYAIADGTPVHIALRALLSSFIPGTRLRLNIPTSEFTTDAMLYSEDDSSRTVAHSLALAMGARLFMDPMGVATAAPEVSSEDATVMTYEPGPGSMLLRPKRDVDISEAKNYFIVTGEGPAGTVVRGVFADEDPNSLTYWPRIGKHTSRTNSPLMRTAAQATMAARTIGLRELGIPDTIATPITPNPALASGDVLQIKDPAQGIDFPLIVDAFPNHLRASGGDQNLETRSRVIR